MNRFVKGLKLKQVLNPPDTNFHKGVMRRDGGGRRGRNKIGGWMRMWKGVRRGREEKGAYFHPNNTTGDDDGRNKLSERVFIDQQGMKRKKLVVIGIHRRK